MKSYRPELDVLRGVSALATVLFHFELIVSDRALFSSGFLGVDIFFVISGFLISGKLFDELKETNTINIRNFFNRRVRRIIPLLLVVSLVTTMFFFFALSPVQMVDYGWSLIYSLFLNANTYWWVTLQAYAAESSNLKPFLHYWSLAVEEQFYLVFPFLLLILWRGLGKHLGVFFIICTLVGVIVNFHMVDLYPEAVFYLLPFRAWEFFAGAALCIVSRQNSWRLPQKLNLLLSLLSISALLFTLYVMRSTNVDSMWDRSWVIISTVTFIICSNSIWSGILATIFEPFRFLGKISYSMYLWHFPMLVYARFSGHFYGYGWKIALFTALIPLSALSYVHVENRFRYKKNITNKKLYRLVALVSVILITFGTLAVTTDGLPRNPGSLRDKLSNMKLERRRYWIQHDNMRVIDPTQPTKTSVAVIGNSWALDLAVAIGGHKEHYQVYFNGMTGACRAFTLPSSSGKTKKRNCSDNISRFKKDYSFYDLVLIADDRSFIDPQDNEAIRELDKNIGFIREFGYSGPILLVGNRPTWKQVPIKIVHDRGAVTADNNQYAQTYLEFPLRTLKEMDATAEQILTQEQVYYYSPVDALCPEGICLLTHNRELLYWDWEHMTPAGARFIRASLRQAITNVLKNSNSLPSEN